MHIRFKSPNRYIVLILDKGDLTLRRLIMKKIRINMLLIILGLAVNAKALTETEIGECYQKEVAHLDQLFKNEKSFDLFVENKNLGLMTSAAVNRGSGTEAHMRSIMQIMDSTKNCQELSQRLSSLDDVLSWTNGDSPIPHNEASVPDCGANTMPKLERMEALFTYPSFLVYWKSVSHKLNNLAFNKLKDGESCVDRDEKTAQLAIKSYKKFNAGLKFYRSLKEQLEP